VSSGETVVWREVYHPAERVGPRQRKECNAVRQPGVIS